MATTPELGKLIKVYLDDLFKFANIDINEAFFKIRFFI